MNLIVGFLRCVVMVTVLVLLSPATQAEVPLIRHFAKEDYQAHYQNWGIANSTDGKIYAANNAGLLEFDGNRWTLHVLPNKQTVRTVVATPDGKIYTGGFASFGYWEQNHRNDLIYHSLDSLIDHPLFYKEEIWKILLVEDTIFFQSFSSLYKFYDGKVETLHPPGNIMYLQRVGEELVIPVINEGLYRLSGQRFSLVPNTQFFSDKRVMFIHPHDAGWLIGTSQSGLFLFINGEIRPVDKPVNAAFRQHQINLGLQLSNGLLAIGTISHGVYILRQDFSILHIIHQENGLQNNTILGLQEDFYHDLWVAMDKGLDLVAVSSPLQLFQDKQGDLGTVYSAALFGNNLYVGTNHGLFYRAWTNSFDPQYRLVEGSQGQVWDVKVFRGQLLIGHNDGTFTLDQGRLRSLTSLAGGWELLSVPHHPELLIQATYTGLILYRWNPTGWAFANRIDNFRNPVNRIRFDDMGSLWAVSPNKGLYRLWFDDQFGSVRKQQTFDQTDGLPSEYHLHLESRRDGIAVGANEDWCLWSEELQHFVPDTIYNTSGYLSGYQGDYFLDQGDHVAYYQNQKLVQRFPVRLIPGYERIELIQDPYYLFCLEDGYALLDRNDLMNPAEPQVAPGINYLESLDQSAVRMAPFGVPGFSYAHNNLRIVYHVPYFRRLPLFRYRYASGATMPDWSLWQSDPIALLTNLHPGHYRFELMSNVSPQSSKIEFEIFKPWYQRTWAVVLFVLGALAILYGFLQFHAFRLRRQGRKLELEKMRKLQQQEIRSRNEQLQQAIINKSKELANTTFNLIRKNEILTQLKEEILEMQKEPVQKHLRHEQHLVHIIDHHLGNEQDWQLFESNFNQVHEAFLKKLLDTHPQLTPGDLRLAAYLKMNLSSKEIAPLLNISLRGVENKRYRLRQKMELASDDNLIEYLLHF